MPRRARPQGLTQRAQKAVNKLRDKKEYDTSYPFLFYKIRKPRVIQKAFRALWYPENKTFGFEVQEAKPSGLIERLNGVKLRLQSYLDENTNENAELEEGAFTV